MSYDDLPPQHLMWTRYDEWQENEALKVIEEEEELREAIRESRGDGEDFE